MITTVDCQVLFLKHDIPLPEDVELQPEVSVMKALGAFGPLDDDDSFISCCDMVKEYALAFCLVPLSPFRTILLCVPVLLYKGWSHMNEISQWYLQPELERSSQDRFATAIFVGCTYGPFLVVLIGGWFLTSSDVASMNGIVYSTMVLLVLLHSGLYYRARHFPNFQTTECVKGALRQHPTDFEQKVTKRQQQKLGKKLDELDYSDMDRCCTSCSVCANGCCSSPCCQTKEQQLTAKLASLTQKPCYAPCCVCLPAWCTFNNILSIALVLLKFCQLSELAIDPPGADAYHSEAPTHFFRYTLLGFEVNVNESEYLISKFWVIVCVVILWECMANILMHAQWTKDYRYFVALPFSAQIVNTLSSALYILIIQQLVFWVDCSVKNNALTLDIFNASDASTQAADVLCWDGWHQFYGMTALFLLVSYTLSTSTLGVFFLEDPAPHVDVRFRETFIILERLLQLIVVLVSRLSSAPGLTEAVSTIVFGVLAFQSLHPSLKPYTDTGVENTNYLCTCRRPSCKEALQVCNVNFICTLLGVCYVLCCWFSMMAWAMSLLILDANERKNRWEPFCVLVAGSVLISFYFVWKHSRWCCRKSSSTPHDRQGGTTSPDSVLQHAEPAQCLQLAKVITIPTKMKEDELAF